MKCAVLARQLCDNKNYVILSVYGFLIIALIGRQVQGLALLLRSSPALPCHCKLHCFAKQRAVYFSIVIFFVSWNSSAAPYLYISQHRSTLLNIYMHLRQLRQSARNLRFLSTFHYNFGPLKRSVAHVH